MRKFAFPILPSEMKFGSGDRCGGAAAIAASSAFAVPAEKLDSDFSCHGGIDAVERLSRTLPMLPEVATLLRDVELNTPPPLVGPPC